MNSIDLNSFVMRFLSRVADIIILSILVLFSCLPIITIGPALIAGFRVGQNMAYDTDSGIVFPFFQYFKNNFKQGILCSLFVLAGISMIVLCFLPNSAVPSPVTTILSTICYTLIFLYWAVLIYLLSLIARYNNTLTQHGINALCLTISNLLLSVLLVVVAGLPLLTFIILPDNFFPLIPVWIFFYPGIALLLISRCLQKTFAKLESATPSA